MLRMIKFASDGVGLIAADTRLLRLLSIDWRNKSADAELKSLDLRLHGLTDCEMALRGNRLLVIGSKQVPKGKRFSDVLGILEVHIPSFAIVREFQLPIEPPYSSPSWISTSLVAVGTGEGIAFLDLEGASEAFRIENQDEYVCRNSLLFSEKHQRMIVVWTYQGGSRISAFDLKEDPKLVWEQQEHGRWLSWGAAMNESQSIACVLQGPLHAISSAMASSYLFGELSIVDITMIRPSIALPVTSDLLSNFRINEQENAVDHSRKLTLYAKTEPSSPVFLDETKLAIGMPSGGLSIMQVEEKSWRYRHVADEPIAAIDFFPPERCVAVGSQSGKLFFLSGDDA